MHAQVDPAIDNSRFHGNYKSLVEKSARLRHKWNRIYIDEPIHTAKGWSGYVAFTHSGTYDDMYVYTIEPSGFVTFKYAGIDREQIDRLKFKVNSRKANSSDRSKRAR